jgi:EmrB/QacA subfamily drug resistance transporter
MTDTDVVGIKQAVVASEARSAERSRGALIAVSLALFCIQIDFFALNLALPDMARAFHVGAPAVQWTVSAYMLALGSMFILAGRVGDIFGRRHTLLAGILLFGIASAACAVAPSLGVLVAFRVVQGAGAAVIFPVGIAALSNEFSDERRAWALGLAFGIANIGTALGPFVGGGLAGGPGWRWIFWVLAPLCALSLWVAAISVRDSRDQSAPRRLDLVGALLVIGGVAAVSIAADRGGNWGWSSPRTIGTFALAGCLLAAFLGVESRIRVPLVDLKLFRNLPYVLVSVMGAVSNLGYAIMIFGATLYLQFVRGLTPLTAGVVFLAPSIMVALSGPIGARLGKHFRPAAVMAAAGLISGSGLLALTFAHAWVAYLPAFALAGLGFGLGWSFANVGTQEVVRPDRAGEASGVVLTILVTAGGIGIAAAAAAIAQLEASGTSPRAAIDGTLRVIALAVIAAAVLVMAARSALVRRGLMAPLSMKAEWTPPST